MQLSPSNAEFVHYSDESLGTFKNWMVITFFVNGWVLGVSVTLRTYTLGAKLVICKHAQGYLLLL